MKLSILTSAHNNADELKEIYDSLIINSKEPLDFEWLIMDEASEDNTKQLVEELIKENKINIKCFYQVSNGKEQAINNLMEYATGKFILECMPGEYLANNAFKIINEKSEIIDINPDLYALAFLKCDIYGEIGGNKFKRDHYKTTMFDLCFKDNAEKNKALLFNKSLREKVKHEVQKRESYIPENRIYFKLDKRYKIVCFNMPLIISFKKNDIDEKEKLIENPVGYTKYYEEILNNDKIKNFKTAKKKYLVKQYLISNFLSNRSNFIKNLKLSSIRFMARRYYFQVYFAAKKYNVKQYSKNSEGKRMKNS